jgi:predicted transcriptional regulator
MKLSEIIKILSLKEVTPGTANLDEEVTSAYVSDLLSDVIANAKKGCLWITLQSHPNIIAVGVMKEVAGIIIVNGRQPDGETVKKAKEEKVPLFTTEKNAFTVAGLLYQAGLR